MKFKEVHLEELQHEHPLILEDLQLMYQDYEEDDDDFDDDDLITTQKFECLCDRCGLGIDWYHRYYYKCSMLCKYSIHKLCAEISTTLASSAHPSHILHLKRATAEWRCGSCLADHQDGLCYHCSTCNYQIDLRCSTFVEQKTIHHPGHPHPLISDMVDSVLGKCSACGEKHEGDFFNCTTCFNFSVNSRCLSLPIKLLLKDRHPHMLTLSYSFSDHLYGRECRICEKELYSDYWLYKCSKCIYYIHLGCTTQNQKLLRDSGRGIGHSFIHDKKYPLPYESNNITHESLGDETYECLDENGYLKHFSHKHPLMLINNNEKNGTSTTSTLGVKLMSLHNPTKRVKLLCNGCVRPITTMPFFKCSQDQYECSNFVLHEWCAKLHTPKNVPENVSSLCLPQSSLFCCMHCGLPCNGFAFQTKLFIIDINCGLKHNLITHEAHPHDTLQLSRHYNALGSRACRACHNIISSGAIIYKCRSCNYSLDLLCALRLTKTIRHKYDEHFLYISYSPIQNHKSQYFCEVCEEELNPDKWFYHCSECSRSIHCACAPLILKSEQGINSSHEELVYKFINMKFGGVHNIEDHQQHSVSFVAGTECDGNCPKCGLELQSKIIFKCLECKFAIHNYCESSITAPMKQQLVQMFDNLEKKREPKIKPQPQKVVTFYPKGIVRPMTRTVDDDDDEEEEEEEEDNDDDDDYDNDDDKNDDDNDVDDDDDDDDPDDL